MPDPSPPLVRPFRESDLEGVVDLWHRAMKVAYPYLPLTQAHTREEDRDFFVASILPRCRLWVCAEDDRPRAFLAMAGDYLDRLYVDPDHQRRGMGGLLLAEAKRASPGGIRLHTHQENHAARAFYEKAGFTAVAFGTSPPPESAPDVAYCWGGS